MRFLYFTFFCAALTTSLSAHAQHSPKQIVEDALRHRSLSEAQAIAAKCSPEKKGLEACVAEAKPLCRGLAIGKHCGLRETATSDFSAALQAASKAHAVAGVAVRVGNWRVLVMPKVLGHLGIKGTLDKQLG